MEITLRYTSIDMGPWERGSARKYKTLGGARRYAHKWVGETPELSPTFGYAVSADGIGKITCEGCSLLKLFPKLAGPEPDPEPELDDEPGGGALSDDDMPPEEREAWLAANGYRGGAGDDIYVSPNRCPLCGRTRASGSICADCVSDVADEDDEPF